MHILHTHRYVHPPTTLWIKLIVLINAKWQKHKHSLGVPINFRDSHARSCANSFPDCSVCMRVHGREGEWVVAGAGLPKHGTSNHAMKAHQRETQMYQALQTKAVNLFCSLSPAQSTFYIKKEKESSGLSFPHENPIILPRPIDEASCLFHLSRLCKLPVWAWASCKELSLAAWHTDVGVDAVCWF